jgi:hypothetical protein
MSQTCWRLVELVSRMLESDEGEAVRGDLAESGEAAGPALRQVLGLVVWRQMSLWRDWRPWLALVALVAPIGLLLGLNSVWIGRSYDLYLWIVRNYGAIDPVILRDTGLRVGHGTVSLVCHSLLLACWSWTAGFVLASLSRRAIGVNGPLFFLMLLVGEGWGAPKYHYYVAGAVFAKTLYSVLLPLILLAVLVLLPSLWGMVQGLRQSTLLLPHAIFLAAFIAAMTVLARPSALWWWNWPVGYMLVTAGWRGLHSKTGQDRRC